MKYSLFDRTKEKKSIKLVRKLQQEADSKWEKKLAIRKEQEAMDEAIAKELQAKEEQEEQERQKQSDTFNPFLSQGSFDSIEAKDRLDASIQYATNQYKPYLTANLLCRSPSPIIDKDTEPMIPLSNIIQLSSETPSTKTDMSVQNNVRPNATQSPTKPALPLRKASAIKDTLIIKKTQSFSTPSPVKYSDSFLLLKPDEKEHDTLISIPEIKPTNQMKTTNTKHTIQILDPTADLIKCQSLPKGKQKAEPYHTYEEKESQEDEHPLRCTSSYQLPMLHHYSFSSPIIVNSNFSQDNQDQINRVYPTNVLKAGAPPLFIRDPNSSRVKAYTNKSLPEHSKPNKSAHNSTTPPEKTERHITVTSIYPGQRSWIKIYPTDTGKILAERISILASYRTRHVTKIITKSGTEIALNNSLLFDDWNDILNFKDGEPWRVEWVPLERSFEDTTRRGKNMVKQLKNIVSKPQACT